MTELFRRAAFIASFIGLALVVTLGAFWLKHEFNESHKTQCEIATAQVEIVAAAPARDGNVRLINDAIDRLNDTCGLDLEHVT